MRPQHSIRAWLGSLVAAVALPLLSLLSFLFGWQLRRELAEARYTALRMAKAMASRIKVQHESSTALLEQLARRPGIRDYDGGACDLPQWADLLFYDRDGHVACSTSPQSEDVLLSQEIRQGKADPNRPTIRLIRGRWVSVVTRPVARGTLVVLQTLDLKPAEAFLPNTVVTILDRDGTVVARSIGAADMIGRNAGNAEVARIALREREGTAAAEGLDGVSRQYGFTQLPELGWTIWAGVPTADVMRPVRQTYLVGTAGGAVIIILISVVALRLTRERERNLKALSERLLTAQEQERMRVGRELHDDLGQALTALKMDVIGLVEKTERSPEVAPMIDRILRTIDATVTSVRRISSELRSSVLDDLGLFDAIEAEARLFEERTGIECDLVLPEEAPDVDNASAVAIYRIIQEALTNVARHSDAGRVEIRIERRGGELFMEICDDGRGIAPAEADDPASLGLIGIRERTGMIGGTVRIEGVPNRGTTVSVRLPLNARSGSEA